MGLGLKRKAVLSVGVVLAVDRVLLRCLACQRDSLPVEDRRRHRHCRCRRLVFPCRGMCVEVLPVAVVEVTEDLGLPVPRT